MLGESGGRSCVARWGSAWRPRATEGCPTTQSGCTIRDDTDWDRDGHRGDAAISHENTRPIHTLLTCAQDEAHECRPSEGRVPGPL